MDTGSAVGRKKTLTVVVIGGVEILDFDDCEWVVLLKSSAGSSSFITSKIVKEKKWELHKNNRFDRVILQIANLFFVIPCPPDMMLAVYIANRVDYMPHIYLIYFGSYWNWIW